MEQRNIQLTSNELKLIALAAMTVDHIGALLLPQYSVLRIIGRLAFPIFAYMIAEGCRHTSHRLRYPLTIFCVGIVVQLLFWYTRQSLYQHILITFTLSILLIYSLEQASEKGGVWIIAAVFALAAVSFICLFLASFLPGRGFRIDYGLCGVLLPVLIFAAQTRAQKLLAAAIGLTGVCIAMGGIQWYSLLALPLLALYRGQRGTYRLKYLFYAYYPIHLMILEGVRIARRR